jgi:predicted HAD superfamily Cof-like phosphohydrolase
MKKLIRSVEDFHRKCGQYPPGGFPDDYNSPKRALRRNLIREEFEEFLEAEEHNDKVAVADALVDMIYVIVGTALEYKIPLEEVFDEIQRSNMTKFIDGYIREDGKYMKGKSYRPPDIEGIINER